MKIRNQTPCRTGGLDLGSEAGFSLIELLIAGLVSLFVVGGVLVMLESIEVAHRDTQELIDAQQTARLSLDSLARDLQLAGVGLAWTIPPLPFVVPRADGGVDIRHNRGGLTASLTADMMSPNDAIFVNDASGFQGGMRIALYDAAGSLDIVTINSVDLATNRITHSGATKAYTTADGSAIARVQTTTYRTLDDGNGNFRLMRSVDGGAEQPIGAWVRNLTFTYYDDSVPPVAFVPVTFVDMLMIRTIEIDIEIETENVKLNTNQKRTATLTTRVTPRAIVLS